MPPNILCSQVLTHADSPQPCAVLPHSHKEAARRHMQGHAAKARRGKKQRVDVDSLKGDELDMALAEAIMQFQEKNEAALKERCAFALDIMGCMPDRLVLGQHAAQHALGISPKAFEYLRLQGSCSAHDKAYPPPLVRLV